jgi:TRAP-type mannitol/chloroaromatic compound transport system permease small subunit
MNRALRLIDRISEYSGKATSFLILLMIILICLETILRYAFNSPTIWSGELTTMVFGAYIILGGAYTLLVGGHVNMDIIHSRLSPRAKAIIDIITFVFFLFFVLVLIWKGSQRAMTAFSTMERSVTEWRPIVFPVMIILVIGSFLLFLQGIAKFARDIQTLIKGRSS